MTLEFLRAFLLGGRRGFGADPGDNVQVVLDLVVPHLILVGCTVFV